MLETKRLLAMFSLVALAAGGAAMIACGGATEGTIEGAPNTSPQTTPEIQNPETGLAVKATIAAASLGDGSANVQIAFFASEASAPATVAITKVLLVDDRSGQTVDTLEASSPAVWNGRTYEPWNEQVTPGGDLRASYTLTAPDWSTIDKGARTGGTTSYSTPYKLRVTLRIDGTEVTIESSELQREPQVAT